MVLFYEDFTIGQAFASGSRLITEDNITDFANLTGDYNKLHFDREFATNVGFTGVISHGLLTLSVALGLWYSLDITNGSTSAFAGLDRVHFKSPVYPGDHLQIEGVVIEKRDLVSNKNSGLVRIKLDEKNEGKKTVLEAEIVLLILKRSF